MKTKQTFCSLLALLLTFTWTASAAHAKDEKPGKEQKEVKKDREVTKRVALQATRVSEIVGSDVVNTEGNDLGEIEELAIEPKTGRIVYAVLSFGGFLDMGDKLFAIPSGILSVSIEGSYLLRVPEEHLENAPGFSEDDWPNMANVRWASSVHEFYGEKPYWESGAARADRIVRSSHLIGKTVRNANDDDIGEIEDLIVDTEKQRVAYAVVSSGGWLDIGDRLIPVPWGAFREIKGTDDEAIVLNIPKDQLKNAPSFEDGSWPDMTDASWAIGVHEHYGATPYWETESGQRRPGKTSEAR